MPKEDPEPPQLGELWYTSMGEVVVIMDVWRDDPDLKGGPRRYAVNVGNGQVAFRIGDGYDHQLEIKLSSIHPSRRKKYIDQIENMKGSGV